MREGRRRKVKGLLWLKATFEILDRGLLLGLSVYSNFNVSFQF